MVFIISGCAIRTPITQQTSQSSYTIKGKTYYPLKKVEQGFTQKGIASWYGPGFHGKKTASGEIYNMHDLTAAHNVLPLKTVVRIRNLENNKEVVVRINDRGPFVDDRVIDLSRAAAEQIGLVTPGTAAVRLTVIGTDELTDAPVQHTAQKAPSTPASVPNPFYASFHNSLVALIK